MGITNIILPHCPNVQLTYAVQFLTGCGSGMLANVFNLLIVELWKSSSGPYMHALHFTYGLGTSIAPLLSNPFLVHDTHTNFTNNTKITDSTAAIDETNWTIKTLYAIVGAYSILVGLVFVYFFTKDSVENASSEFSKTDEHSVKIDENSSKLTKKQRRTAP